MSSRKIITVDMIRRANAKLMENGIKGNADRPIRSEFLGRDLYNPVRADAETINAAWEKVQNKYRG